jgi:ribosomal protein S18 acetylase RimI-like enzyme
MPAAIHRMQQSHLATVAAVHRDAFPSFFTTSLGPSFLKTFYSSFLTHDSAIALVGYEGAEVGGFVVGTVDHQQFHKYMRSNRTVALAAATLRAAVRRPRIVPRLLRHYRTPQTQIPDVTGATLISIAVRPQLQTKGLGQLLLAEFARQVATRGFRNFRLTTDCQHNHRVNRFYLKAGLVVERTFSTAEGRLMNIYKWPNQPTQHDSRFLTSDHPLHQRNRTR